MTPKQERQAEAFAVWKRNGKRAPVFVAERIGELAIKKDLAGVKRWQEIAAALDTLMASGRH